MASYGLGVNVDDQDDDRTVVNANYALWHGVLCRVMSGVGGAVGTD